MICTPPSQTFVGIKSTISLPQQSQRSIFFSTTARTMELRRAIRKNKMRPRIKEKADATLGCSARLALGSHNIQVLLRDSLWHLFVPASNLAPLFARRKH
jgi:hypothetical protein